MTAGEMALGVWAFYIFVWVIVTIIYTLEHDTVYSLTWNWILFSIPALPAILFMLCIVPVILVANWAWKNLEIPVFRRSD